MPLRNSLVLLCGRRLMVRHAHIVRFIHYLPVV
jgi:hypothetical protein